MYEIENGIQELLLSSSQHFGGLVFQTAMHQIMSMLGVSHPEDGKLLDPAFPNWGTLETWVKVDKKKYKACLMATDANIARGTVTHMQFCAQQSRRKHPC